MFGGNNPVLGMLKHWQRLAVSLLNFCRFRESHNLRNILVMFPLDNRKSSPVAKIGLRRTGPEITKKRNSLKTTSLAIENFYSQKVKMSPEA